MKLLKKILILILLVNMIFWGSLSFILGNSTYTNKISHYIKHFQYEI